MSEKFTPTISVNDIEIELIKSVFADNKDLLKLMRNLFFGLTLTDAEKQTIKDTFSNEQLRYVIRQRFLPELSKDTPLEVVADTWLGMEGQLQGKRPEEIYQAVRAKAEANAMTETALNLLENPDGIKPVLKFIPNLINDEYAIGLIGRNIFIGRVQYQLNTLAIIAGSKKESAAEAKKRMTADSMK